MENLANEERIKRLTKKHYRKFYKDELENIRTIFPKPIFSTLDIMRGAQRGVKPSLFSFFSKHRKD